MLVRAGWLELSIELLTAPMDSGVRNMKAVMYSDEGPESFCA